VHVPIWPVAALVTAALAAVIGISLIDSQGSTIGSRSENAWTTAQAEALLSRLAVQEASSAAVREAPAVAPIGVSHVAPSRTEVVTGLENAGAYTQARESFAGFENPGAYVTIQGTTYMTGLENPGAYPAVGADDGGFTPSMGPRPGMRGDAICGQCR
jgi:hypothetical protein